MNWCKRVRSIHHNHVQWRGILLQAQRHVHSPFYVPRLDPSSTHSDPQELKLLSRLHLSSCATEQQVTESNDQNRDNASRDSQRQRAASERSSRKCPVDLLCYWRHDDFLVLGEDFGTAVMACFLWTGRKVILSVGVYLAWWFALDRFQAAR